MWWWLVPRAQCLGEKNTSQLTELYLTIYAALAQARDVFLFVLRLLLDPETWLERKRGFGANRAKESCGQRHETLLFLSTCLPSRTLCSLLSGPGTEQQKIIERFPHGRREPGRQDGACVTGLKKSTYLD